VGRVDKGINRIADLEGKTIGVPLGSRPEFALDRFLYFRGIDASEVTLVNVPVNQSVDALVNGNVDAVVAWQPYIDQIGERMGDRVVAWSVQEDQPSYTLVMCSAEWTVENPELITRFLKSLVQAESYIVDNPEAVRAFIQEKLNYSADYVASIWPDYRFSVLLDQALVVAMEDQARWIISNDLATEKQTPNFVNYIYVDGLEAVKPEAVNIIR
jgi:NitT/TauT family transport system substrate-binding protein